MRGIFRGILAAVGAKWLGGRMGCGCLGTIVLFLILYWLLGQF